MNVEVTSWLDEDKNLFYIRITNYTDVIPPKYLVRDSLSTKRAVIIPLSLELINSLPVVGEGELIPTRPLRIQIEQPLP